MVIPLTTRNLLYTAITRANRLVVLVGSEKAFGQADRTVGSGRDARWHPNDRDVAWLDPTRHAVT